LGNTGEYVFTGPLRKARGGSGKEIILNRDVKIGERYRGKVKRIGTWSCIPFRIINRP